MKYLDALWDLCPATKTTKIWPTGLSLATIQLDAGGETTSKENEFK